MVLQKQHLSQMSAMLNVGKTALSVEVRNPMVEALEVGSLLGRELFSELLIYSPLSPDLKTRSGLSFPTLMVWGSAE